MSNCRYCSTGSVLFICVLQCVFLVFYYYIKLLPIFEHEQYSTYKEDEVISRDSRHNYSSNISQQCIAMFNIGYGHNRYPRNLNTFLDNEFERLQNAKENFEQETEDYLPFTKSLVKLVATTNDGRLKFRIGTRIQIMKGKLPYVPCLIRDYSNEDFHKCIKVRKERNKPLWIAYFGDSLARNMLFYLLNSTHSFMNWTMNGNKTFEEKYFYKQAEFQDYGSQLEFESVLGDRMTFLGSPYGMLSKKDEKHIPANLLLEWAWKSDSKRLPDILILEFGKWHFSWSGVNHIFPHEMYHNTWKPLRTVLRKLSRHITIICHVSTRIKFSGIKHEMKQHTMPKDRQMLLQGLFMINQAVSFIDQVVKYNTRRSNIIFWDSTLPLILASDLECGLLVKHNHSSVAEEGKLHAKHFLRFMCNDPIHQTRATVHDERSIILNLACNRFLFKSQEEYCCSI